LRIENAESPACPRTRFRLQSVSKTLTAAAMARLVQRGALDLDAPVRTYVPGLPAGLGDVTSRQLASHRAGVRHYHDDNEALNTTRYETAAASLEKFRDDPLLFPPDASFLYSSYGFVLLSAAMEGASGLEFPSLMRLEVFEPLDLNQTDVERSNAGSRDRTSLYDNVTPYSPDGRVVASPALDFSSKWASGGMLSTADDLVRFGAAHIPPMNRGFLDDRLIEELFTPRTTQLVVFGQGLGWSTARDHRGRRVQLHFGAGSGGTSFLALYPDQQVSIAILANLGHARFPMPRLLGVAHAFAGDPLEPAAWILAIGLVGGVTVVLSRRKGSRNRTVR
jgi:CubicO group peptidase (beta-lactamase class C family)